MVKILRILVAAPFIGVGFIPLLFGALMMLIAYRCMTIFKGKNVDDTGTMIDVKSLMGMFGGDEGRRYKEDDKTNDS